MGTRTTGNEVWDLLLCHLRAIDRLEADIGYVRPQVRNLLARVLRV